MVAPPPHPSRHLLFLWSLFIFHRFFFHCFLSLFLLCHCFFFVTVSFCIRWISSSPLSDLSFSDNLKHYMWFLCKELAGLKFSPDSYNMNYAEGVPWLLIWSDDILRLSYARKTASLSGEYWIQIRNGCFNPKSERIFQLQRDDIAFWATSRAALKHLEQDLVRSVALPKLFWEDEGQRQTKCRHD